MSWLEKGGTTTVCYCKSVNKMDILSAIMIEGARSIEDVKRVTGACTGSDCERLNPAGRCCSSDIEEILELYLPVFDDLQKGHDHCSGDCSSCGSCEG